MNMMRSVLLAGAQSPWLRERAPRLPFVRRTASRFIPGETLDAALTAAAALSRNGIATLVTHLGENITDAAEARKEALHYGEVLGRIREAGLPTELSIKLTQLGLDLGATRCYDNLERIIEKAGSSSTVWIDMEASAYVDITLELYMRARTRHPNVGVCLQAYLYRTAKDLAALMPLGPSIRLVKGAYQEPASVAFPRKVDVDANYLAVARQLLGRQAQQAGLRAAFATHDSALIGQITSHAQAAGVAKTAYEFQMLYGIRRDEQLRLAREGCCSKVLITYGSAWFPWFMRRMAERPANMLFVLRNLVGG
jgi:proline dehydrogenase